MKLDEIVTMKAAEIAEKTKKPQQWVYSIYSRYVIDLKLNPGLAEELTYRAAENYKQGTTKGWR
jgi:hypothetical protein